MPSNTSPTSEKTRAIAASSRTSSSVTSGLDEIVRAIGRLATAALLRDSSVAGQSSLGEVLEGAGVDTVVITGYMTHMCVDTTSRQAAHRGLAVEILNDATGTLPLENSGGKAGGEA